MHVSVFSDIPYARYVPLSVECVLWQTNDRYNLVSGLLLNLADAGDPSLDFRTKTANKPTSLRTSDRNSLLRYMGLPLHTFGKVSIYIETAAHGEG
jgi:hypothetical protein